ncbi:MAG TPA: energy transducer TonB [Chthoniobacterales bacterium]
MQRFSWTFPIRSKRRESIAAGHLLSGSAPVVCALLLCVGCTQISYQDRARTPLKPMKSVVHVKSKAFDIPPRVLEGERPAYPEPEGSHREKGFVSVICTVGLDGKASDFEIENMTDPAFAYEAMLAIQKWRWAPAMKDGHPVVQKVRVPMHFNAI